MIEWLFQKNRVLVISLLSILIFTCTLSYVFADPPGSAYTPGQTLQPSCDPGDTNCTVLAPFAIGTSISSATAGSVLFAGTSGVLAQDNSNLFWDDTNNQLRLGTGSASLPSYTFSGDTTTGIFNPSAGTIGFTFSGTQRYSLSSTSFASGTSGGFTLIRAVGSATAPTYAFTGDANTGIYRDTADTLEFTTGGSERARFDSSGNFGLGDNSPASLLTVGSGDLFQVNSSGAIAAATGITSSGSINFSGLTASKAVFTDGSKNLTSSGTLGVDQGGSGLTATPTNGQVLIGNGSGFTLATLTASTGISITTGSGSISISATGVSSNEFADNVFRVIDDGDGTKKVAFEASGITTGTTRTLTIPNSSGTIALTADLSNYFPLVGGTLAGTGGSGFIGFPAQSSSPSTPASGFNLYADSNGKFSWRGTNGFIRTFDGTANTADRAYTLPDAAGTVALTNTPGTSGTDVNWSAAGTLNIPDASTSARGVVTTGVQTFAGAKSFSGNVSLNASSFVYRTTNAGSNISSQIMIDIDGSASTAGSQAVAFESANGVVFTAANGTRRIARAAIKLTNLVNTSGSETGDLSFYTKPSGGAITERFRIDTSGHIFASSAINTSSGTPDAVCINTSTYEISRNSGAQTCTVSSLRFKHNVETLSVSGLSEINALRPVSFEYNDTTDPRIGFIAEDVVLVDPRLVFYESDGVTVRGVRYEDITSLLTKAIQELDLKLEPLTSLDLNQAGSLASLIKQFLENAANGVGTFFADKIQTHELCLDDICVTKSQLENLLQNQQQGGGATGDTASSGSTVSGEGTGTVGESETTGESDTGEDTTIGTTGETSGEGTTTGGEDTSGTSGDTPVSRDTGGGDGTTGSTVSGEGTGTVASGTEAPPEEE